MQSHRILSGLTIFVMVVLVAAGWFLVAQPQLAAASTANTNLSGVQAQIQSTQATIAQLQGEQKKVPELTKQLAALQESIPAEANSSSYIDGLNLLAATAGVTITAITVGDAVQYSPAVAPAAASAATPTASPSPTPAPSASTAPKAPVGWVPPTNAGITASNFIAIPVSITAEGSWAADLAFIDGLQTGKRLLLINGIATAPNATDATVTTAKISGYIYVLLDPKVAALQAKTATPTPTPTVTPTPTPTVSASPNPSGSSTPTPTTSPTP